MSEKENTLYRILIVDDDSTHHDKIRDIILQVAKSRPDLMNINPGQLTIDTISRSSEVDAITAEIISGRPIPYNIILSDIFMPLENNPEPSIDGGWMRFYLALSKRIIANPDINEELLLVPLTDKSEQAIPVRKIINDQKQKSGNPWLLSILHKPDSDIIRNSATKTELLDENSWAYLIATIIRKYNDKLWKNTFINCTLDDYMPISVALSDVKAAAQRYANERIIVVLGEIGTGREYIAQLIHDFSERSGHDNSKYIEWNCNNVTIAKIESEILGIEADTALSSKTKSGLLERSKGGTVFIDGFGLDDERIGIILNILRKIMAQKWSFHRIGGSRQQDFTGSIVLSSPEVNLMENPSLQGINQSEELYQIFNSNIFIPPLRERPLDIVPLANELLQNSQKNTETLKNIDNSAERYLKDYSWPGNVKELEALMEKIARNYILGQEVSAEVIKRYHSENIYHPNSKPANRSKDKKQSPNLQKDKADKLAIMQKLVDWVKEGEACFVIQKNNRVMFSYKDKFKDMRLKNGSRAQNFLVYLCGDDSGITSADINNKHPSGEKPSSIVRSVNKTLFDKIITLGFFDIPKDSECIFFNKKSQLYVSIIPIKTKDEYEFSS